MRRIAVTAAVGWGWIVWLGWSLADRRIAICDYSDDACQLRATAARDAVLTHGLTVLLVGAILAALVAGGIMNKVRRQGGNVLPENAAQPLLGTGSGEVWRSWRGRASRVDRRSIVIGAAVLGLGIVAITGLDRSAAWVGLGHGPAPEATETAADATDGAAGDFAVDQSELEQKFTPTEGNPFAPSASDANMQSDQGAEVEGAQ